ncbi:MAG: hypothetical protein QGH15_21855, partial [Kiritimatiellia bacterium]|nr:hypothetical protein [Kiritimatiellia bacterium]
DLLAVGRWRLCVVKEVLALVVFTADNYNESRFVPGLQETFLKLARNLLFPFSMEIAMIRGIPHSMVQSPG